MLSQLWCFIVSREGDAMRVGQARRRDAAEPAIIAALKAVGADVTQISGKGAPDLLVDFRGRLYAFEVKSDDGTQTRAQRKSNWPIVRDADGALASIGIHVRR